MSFLERIIDALKMAGVVEVDIKTAFSTESKTITFFEGTKGHFTSLTEEQLNKLLKEQ